MKKEDVSRVGEHTAITPQRATAPPTEAIRASKTCSGCGGPYRFDTSVPSVLWNRVIRAQGLPDCLCATCVLEAFAKAGVPFTAELSGDGLNGIPIEVIIDGELSTAVKEVQDENNTLRWKLRQLEQGR